MMSVTATLGDVNTFRPQAASHPSTYITSCVARRRLVTKGEIFSKFCNMMKTQKAMGGGSGGPSILAVLRWGYKFSCTPKG